MCKNSYKQPIKGNKGGWDKKNLMMKCFLSMVCLSKLE